MDKTSEKRLYKFELYIDGEKQVQGEGRDFETVFGGINGKKTYNYNNKARGL